MRIPYQAAGVNRYSSARRTSGGISTARLRSRAMGGLAIGAGPGLFAPPTFGATCSDDDGLCWCADRLGIPCDDMASKCRSKGASRVDCIFDSDGTKHCFCDYGF